ncbi:MAG: hypothetical protein ABSE20_29265 [Acetobacteraceae bacterium]|jgi:hypothetical protein
MRTILLATVLTCVGPGVIVAVQTLDQQLAWCRGDYSERLIPACNGDRVTPAFNLHATLRQRRALAPGLTPRAVLDEFAAVQMIDVHVPTTDGLELTLTRHTEPEPALRLLIEKLKLRLPDQPSHPGSPLNQHRHQGRCSEDL